MPPSISLSRSILVTAAALALATAVSLGLARFSYALLLPPMRADLGWSYFTAGAMNTVNAAGYLAGALLAPWWLRRVPARTLLLASTVVTGVLLALHGAVRADAPLYVLRALTGCASAGTFVGGGLLAAQLASREPARAGLVLGIYYGGAGLGIVVSSLLVPPLTAGPHAPGWPWAWAALGVAGIVAAALTARWTGTLTRGERAGPATATAASTIPGQRFPLRPFAAGLAAYFCFGLGYIGYMTFIVTLLREQQLGPGFVTVFYTMLGLATIASSWLWAGLLQRHRDGRPLALLNGLLAVATLLPVASGHPVAVLASAALFGSVFLSVVASTTALVRHNVAPGAWPRGISAFTIAFAAGQIIGPGGVGRVADSGWGLRGGLAVSAGVLVLACVLALRQHALPRGNGSAHDGR